MKTLSTLFVILFIHLTSFSQLASTAVQQTSTSCNGICDGTAFIITTGGQPPYIITGPAANAPQTYTSGITLFGICAGTNTFLVTDALNQTVPVIVTIAQPAQLILTTNPTNETTIGACDGQIVALVTGGTSPFMYSINGGVGQGSSTFGNLCAGSYQVCVTDANGCTTCNPTVTVGSNSGVNCSTFAVTSVQQQNITCNGACDGSAFLIATGATPPYVVSGNFTNSPVTFTAGTTLSGFCAGPQIVGVTSADGCVFQYTMVFTEPSPLILTASPTNESSTGACDGQIAATATGGTAPYTYTLNGMGQPTGTMGNLCAVSYQVCVTDANGCTSCNTTVTVGSNSGVNCSTFAVTSVQQQNITCNGACDGSAFLIATGATPPYVVSGNFTNSPVTFTSGTTLSGFCAGPQIVGVTSADGCVFQYTMVFTEPSPLVLTASPTNESSTGACDGQIAATATGGTAPYTYTLNGMGQPTGTMGNLCAGSYQVCVTDANGCTTCNPTVTVGSNSGCNLVTTQFQHTPASCNGTCDGTLVIAASGGQLPYIVSGNFTGSPFTFTSSAYLQGLCGGTTTLTVSSSDGCISYMNVSIVEPPAIQVAATISVNVSSIGSCDGVLVGTATGGTPGYVYNWMDCITQASMGTQPTLGNACAGDYAFQATDINGCTVTSSCVTLSTTSSLAENENTFDFNIFPNPSNGLFTVELNSLIENHFEMLIQDISGSIVYKTILSTDYQTFELNNELSNGVYLVTLNGISNKTFKLVIQK